MDFAYSRIRNVIRYVYLVGLSEWVWTIRSCFFCGNEGTWHSHRSCRAYALFPRQHETFIVNPTVGQRFAFAEILSSFGKVACLVFSCLSCFPETPAHQTRDVEPVLVWRRASVADGDPALNHNGSTSRVCWEVLVEPTTFSKVTELHPSKGRWPNVVLKLGHRRRRCPNFN